MFGSVDLRGPDGQALESVLLQPKRLALLVYLVLTAGGLRRRDSVLALFWPELAEDQARGALRQSLYFLRHALGPEMIIRRPDGDIDVASDRFWCDAIAFERLLSEGRRADALQLYRADLLAGFYVPNASAELQQWLDGQRDRLRRLAANASSDLAESLDRAGVALESVRWAHWACERLPEDEALLRRLIALLDRRGDRYGALLAYERFAERTAREFGAEPAPETRELIEAVRAREWASPGAPATVGASAFVVGAPAAGERSVPHARASDGATASSADEGSVFGTAGPTARRSPRRWFVAAGVAASVVVALGLSLLSFRDRGLAAPAGGVTTARRLFEEARRAQTEGDGRLAARLFFAAVEEDSTLAIAAFHATGYARDSGDFARFWGLALRHAAHAPVDERLVIRLEWARATGDPTEVAYAESLRTVAPMNPASHVHVALSLMGTGDFSAGVEALRKALALDARRRVDDRAGKCAECEVYGLMAHAYTMMDSVEAAHRVAREWSVRHPERYQPWELRAWLFAVVSMPDSARSAWSRAASLRKDGVADPLAFAHVLILAGEYAQAERVIETASRSGAASAANDVMWWRVIALRNMGRFEEALQAARAYERHVLTEQSPESRRVPRAVVLLETGRSREALAIFDSMAAEKPPRALSLPSSLARLHAWTLTRAATAAAMAGDTSRLALLADTIERVGRASYYERDRRLHHYVRANLLAARGDLVGAVDAYRRSIFSTTGGYTRANFELGNVLLALGRADEAVSIVRSALHAGAEASNLYVTRTELHALLARAHEMAGARDSAAAHYRRVVAAWRHGDPVFRERAALASARRTALQRQQTAPH